ncbi:DUF397 domain-containing protein [Herbihabitans rhizosphaerae]|uniref:DUF397 domain-containing protein n=1 Tax=Herbihabitans rhizosphaerae TaxID=1872711 RepID=UPI00102ADD3C|nr:DUF397 domain-containing protein [Herbihabitans rhizosphaerae]
MELAVVPGTIVVRDSKNTTGSLLVFGDHQFRRFLRLRITWPSCCPGGHHTSSPYVDPIREIGVL